jgi:hypothetical protein
VGDYVIVLSKPTSGNSEILGIRRILAEDEYPAESMGVNEASFGLVFDTLHIPTTGKSLEILIMKGTTAYKASVSLSPVAGEYGATATKSGQSAIEVVSLNRCRLETVTNLDNLFSTMGFGDANCPTMAGTSDISSGQTLGTLLYGGSYKAAQNSSTWNTSSIVPSNGGLVSDNFVTNIFGEQISVSGDLFRRYNTFIVYQKRQSVWARYFINVG